MALQDLYGDKSYGIPLAQCPGRERLGHGRFWLNLAWEVICQGHPRSWPRLQRAPVFPVTFVKQAPNPGLHSTVLLKTSTTPAASQGSSCLSKTSCIGKYSPLFSHFLVAPQKWSCGICLPFRNLLLSTTGKPRSEERNQHRGEGPKTTESSRGAICSFWLTWNLTPPYLWAKEGLPQGKKKSNYISLQNALALGGKKSLHQASALPETEERCGPCPHCGAIWVALRAWRRGLWIRGRKVRVADKRDTDPRKIRSGYFRPHGGLLAYKWSAHLLSLPPHNWRIIV